MQDGDGDLIDLYAHANLLVELDISYGNVSYLIIDTGEYKILHLGDLAVDYIAVTIRCLDDDSVTGIHIVHRDPDPGNYKATHTGICALELDFSIKCLVVVFLFQVELYPVLICRYRPEILLHGFPPCVQPQLQELRY